MNVLKKSINLKLTKEGGLKKVERPENKRNQENIKRPLPKSNCINLILVLVTTKQTSNGGTVTVKQNYKSTPTVLNKVNELVRLDKDKYFSQKNEAKPNKPDIQYFSNDHKKNPCNLPVNYKKSGTRFEKFSKDEENFTDREFKTDIMNKLLKKSEIIGKNMKLGKKGDTATQTHILTTNCTDNIKESNSLQMDAYHNPKLLFEPKYNTIEEAKQNNIIEMNSNQRVFFVESDTLENDILLSIQNFGTLLRINNSKGVKIDENSPDIIKLNNLLNSIKTGHNDSSQLLFNENNTIRRDTFINDNYNKKQCSRQETSLFNTLKRENIINGIYLNSDMRIKKYGIFFDFFSENIKEINNFLKPPENFNNLSRTSTLRIIEKTISNAETNKVTSNVVSEFSLFNESEKNDQRNSQKKFSPNMLNKDITLCDYNCSDMHENAIVNKPNDLSAAKININIENVNENYNNTNTFNNNLTLLKMNSYEKKNSILELFDNRSINSEICRNGVVYDDDQIMKNLEFEINSNVSSMKNISKYFRGDSHRNDPRIVGSEIDPKDPNLTIQFNNFSGNTNRLENKNIGNKIALRINNIKNKLSLDQTYKMDEFYSPNNENEDKTIIHYQYNKSKDETYLNNNLKTEKYQK